MSVVLRYDSLFVVKSDGTKCFFAEFSSSLNIIYGKNTSGKSTALLSILYCLGINDVKESLLEVLSEGVIFRLKTTVSNDNRKSDITFIRDSSFLYIIEENKIITKFSGITSDNSAEHIKLKIYISKLLGCSLTLLSNGEYKPAPIEAMLLPYYISQAVGWVYLRKSFANLDYFKNFKEDYLDYYLGVDNSVDRQRRTQVETELELLKTKINLTSRIVSENDDIQIAKIVNEDVPPEIPVYVQKFSENNADISKYERELSIISNELSFFTERKKVLFLISKNNLRVHSNNSNCPVCSQPLPRDIETEYKNAQDSNDTKIQIEQCKAIIEKKQSVMNGASLRLFRT